jgi:hypothetical protein
VVDKEVGGKDIDTINVRSDRVNTIDYIPHIITSKSLSMKYLTSWWISRAPEYEPICPIYLRATESDQVDEMKTDQGAREVQEQVEAGEEVLNPGNTSSIFSTSLNTINNAVWT